MPSLNTWKLRHWAKQARERKKYEVELLVQKMNDYPQRRYVIFPIRKCSIIVRSYRYGLITDSDNKILKGLLDALVNVGIIEDDKEELIGTVKYLQYIDRSNRRTEIIIETEDE